jgi:hypothetical protein
MISVSTSGIEGNSPAELRAAAQHCLKIISSIDEPSVACIINVLVMVQLNALINVNWEAQEDRDRIPSIIANEVLAAFRELDDYDVEHGGQA